MIRIRGLSLKARVEVCKHSRWSSRRRLRDFYARTTRIHIKQLNRESSRSILKYHDNTVNLKFEVSSSISL